MKTDLINEINTLGLPQDGTDLKSRDQFDTKLIASIDINKEWSNLSDDILKSSVRLVNEEGRLRVYLGKDKVTLRFSKNGYLYGKVGKEYLPVPFIARLFDVLLTDTVIKHTIKGGMFEYIPLQFNNSILWLHYHIEQSRILYVSNEEVIGNVLGGISRKFLSKEIDSKPIYLVATTGSNEIYGDIESSLGWIATNDLIERLEIVKEVIEEAKSYTSLEVNELLNEIREMLEE